MSDHGEPWKIEKCKAGDYEFPVVVGSHGGIISSRYGPHQRRMAACVNALEGIPTEVLENLKDAEHGEPWVLTAISGKEHPLWCIGPADNPGLIIVKNTPSSETMNRIVACINALQGVPTRILEP